MSLPFFYCSSILIFLANIGDMKSLIMPVSIKVRAHCSFTWAHTENKANEYLLTASECFW